MPPLFAMNLVCRANGETKIRQYLHASSCSCRSPSCGSSAQSIQARLFPDKAIPDMDHAKAGRWSDIRLGRRRFIKVEGVNPCLVPMIGRPPRISILFLSLFGPFAAVKSGSARPSGKVAECKHSRFSCDFGQHRRKRIRLLSAAFHDDEPIV